MTATLDAVSSVDLPIWVGLTIGPEEGHDVSKLGAELELREGGPLTEAVELAKGYGRIDAFCLPPHELATRLRTASTKPR